MRRQGCLGDVEAYRVTAKLFEKEQQSFTTEFAEGTESENAQAI
jgi:hypothetical protein